MGRAENKAKSQAMAGAMKAAGIERTTQQCPVCYATISCDGPKSKFHHVCGKRKGDDD